VATGGATSIGASPWASKFVLKNSVRKKTVIY
jgi:hypothetical protein